MSAGFWSDMGFAHRAELVRISNEPSKTPLDSLGHVPNFLLGEWT